MILSQGKTQHFRANHGKMYVCIYPVGQGKLYILYDKSGKFLLQKFYEPCYHFTVLSVVVQRIEIEPEI